MQNIETKINEIDAENIICVMSTTSCFAPRACDNIEVISQICKRTNIYHLVNNAYGLSNRSIMKRINKASLYVLLYKEAFIYTILAMRSII